jgi:hypothetical protein
MKEYLCRLLNVLLLSNVLKNKFSCSSILESVSYKRIFCFHFTPSLRDQSLSWCIYVASVICRNIDIVACGPVAK